MCWLIAYRENKIATAGVVDYTLYNKVNVFEKDYMFSMHEVDIEGEKYFSITHNLCACDFFSTKSGKANDLRLKPLRDEFKQFIMERMENPCVEPIVITKWKDGDEECLTSPSAIMELEKSDINLILENEMECIYKIIRS